MLVFEEEWEVFGDKVQSPLRGYLGEGVREFLDLPLQDIQNLVKESPEGGVVFSLEALWVCGLPGAPSGDLVGIPLIYSGRSRILHLQEFFFSLRNYLLREWDWVCGLGQDPLRDSEGYPPRSLHSPRTPAVSGCAETEHIWRDSLCPLSPPPGGRSGAGESSPPPDRTEGLRPSSGLKGGAGIRGHIWRTG